MLVAIDRENLPIIHDPSFRAYAEQYVRIAETLAARLRETGLPLEPAPETEPALRRLQAKGAVVRNDGKSVYSRWISPACTACRTGAGSVTFFISLRCHRRCFYCFNPNQEGFTYFRHTKRDVVAELRDIAAAGFQVDHVALTGGEPLLHKPEAVSFFREARRLFPEATTRLYTSGDFVDEAVLQELREAGLQEIRFSIRLPDGEAAQRHTLSAIALAREFVPRVMVEMPVLPGSFDRMTQLLQELDGLRIAGINLLELCYPFHNVEAFRARGYRLKWPPYRVLYNYWYAGGLPVAGSETECLRLVEWSLDHGLSMGVHYCSLENKHTGQVYQQNAGGDIPPHHVFSERDFFFKTVKAFGEEMGPVMARLRHQGVVDFGVDDARGYVEFLPTHVPLLRGLPVQLALSTAVMESRDDGEYLRELRVDLTTPDTFDLHTDV
ncbi:MAG: radical SAM protein [Limnochordaceae bacterium]|nr:radical SAM protein [Limnochordaceae bacterium]